MKGNNILIDESKSSMDECSKLLNEISNTCCMPERSTNMTAAFSKIENIVEELKLIHADSDNVSNSVENSITHIGSLGGMIGYLYATCCTTTREPLYQKMYKEMNSAHAKLWQFLGHSH